MIYLIGQLGLWLILTLVFASLAGWAFAAQRAAPAERAIRRERDGLLRDLIAMTSGEAGAANDEVERARGDDAVRRMMDIKDGRIRELEQALEGARRRADEAASRIAELERAVESGGADVSELRQLRALAAEHEMARARTLDVETAEVEEPQQDDDSALQMWRLRYFEQRVRYLETQARAPREAAPVPSAQLNALDWRAREAEARADHLASELRAAEAPAEEAPVETEPFAANADVDTLLRWRLLYLERRVAHLQAAPAEAAPMPMMADERPDPDRWKWRAHYLEARVRHLEQRFVAAEPAPMQAAAAPVANGEASPRPAPTGPRGLKPPVLGAARNGAPDDFTLIEGVTALQQSTLNAIGVFHFDQIAAWTPDNVAWVDRYLRLNGRIDDEDWVDQAGDLARDGVAAARRSLEEEA